MPKPGDKGYLIGNMRRKITLLEGELARTKARVEELEADARRSEKAAEIAERTIRELGRQVAGNAPLAFSE